MDAPPGLRPDELSAGLAIALCGVAAPPRRVDRLSRVSFVVRRSKTHAAATVAELLMERIHAMFRSGPVACRRCVATALFAFGGLAQATTANWVVGRVI